ncbi:hypothetical protein SERLA73DRAFT_190871 [Serpula lacrymans var. lacrymans S7.3]|uniref:Uncharacterized protein n=2 Tax=Serpula lacrymans var. lacrymans TaxID=341189 RepID=F8QGJ2_SERL3|nr:uncharacterized protein SERLADRAFT_456842 [Serpula lacrymans var. lacrymans S7.9]EGN92538.1 hypothetical protein SERLA73DRAFT_190871 [Serpula lacrymans var. lacrymans S7.3]EGO29284.1 hypothetical protein SERLADRAFT_456842 [Serpula lacrymans var. lacrymans S7.9]
MSYENILPCNYDTYGSSSAAVQLTTGGNPTRVYYQNVDGRIHELAGNGPLSSGYKDDVLAVAENPRVNTPIAVTTWNDFQQIRVYYINERNEVIEAVYASQTGWVPGAQNIGAAVPGSGLLWAVVDPAVGIRVGYQSVYAPGTITEALYSMSNEVWTTDNANIY